MAADTALIEKREELKRRLAAGEYRTLIDVLFDGISRIIQKITRNPRPISPWYSMILLWLVIMLIGPGLMIVFGEIDHARHAIVTFTSGELWLLPALMLLPFVSLYAINLYIHLIISTFRFRVLDTVESSETLKEIEHWLSTVCNLKGHLIFSVTVGILMYLYFFFIFPFIGSVSVSGFGLTFLYLATTIILAAFLYLLFRLMALSARIGRFDLKLYAVDPSSSEVIGHLSSLMSRGVYGIGIYAAIITIMTAVFGVFLQAGLVLVPLLWIPISAMFILNQNSLASIIRRAKWKTLNEIQARVEQLTRQITLAKRT
jgi:hypothetical protein